MANVGLRLADAPRGGGLLKVLGLAFGLAVGVGAMVGAGILRTPGAVAAHLPSAGVLLALWAVAAVHSALSANIVAELMTATPRSGGVFNVAQRAFGAGGALLVGWTDWLGSVASLAALGIAAAEFLAALVPAIGPHVGQTGAAIVLALIGLNWLGVREGSGAQILTSSLKAVLLAAMIVTIFVLGPERTAEGVAAARPALSFLGLIVAYQLIIGAYAGWANGAYFAEEDPRPQVTIPRALFGAVALVSLIYLLFNAALLHALGMDGLRGSELPAAASMAVVVGVKAAPVVAAVALVTVLGCINANIMVATRVLHGLAREGFLPAVFGRINRGGTPDTALAVTAVLSIGLALSGSFELVFLAMGALGQLVIALTDVAFFRLRWKEPAAARPFRALGYPAAPALALILDVGVLIAFLAADLRSAAFMAAAIAVCIPLAALRAKAPPPIE